MDNVVTSTWVFDKDDNGNGVVHEYVGGYADYVVQRNRLNAQNRAINKKAEKEQAETAKSAIKKDKATSTNTDTNTAKSSQQTATKRKLSFNEQRELDALPEQIAKLEAEQEELQGKLADGTWFSTDLEGATKASERLAEIETELMQKLERWDELEG